MKTSRAQLSPSVAIPPGYDSFFSFPVSRTGYSGVAVYSKSTICRALDAEEGLTGNFGPTFLSTSSTTCPYPSAEDVELPEDISLRDLDAEGRVLVLDFGLFVLLNVYAPALTDLERLPFKLAFHRLLRARVKSFLKAGREVLIVGDLNVCSTPLDTADGHLASVRESWWEDRPDRAWLRDWIIQDGIVDVIRRFWPERKGMFTCMSKIIIHSAIFSRLPL
jgi:AP endonuclease 2